MSSARCFRIVFGFIGLMFFVSNGQKSRGEGRSSVRRRSNSPCQRARKDLFKKGTPASARNRHRGWHGAVCAPVHGCRKWTTFFDPDPCQWAGVNCYSAIDAENRTKATAISRMKTVRMADALLFPLAPCRAHGRRATVHGGYSVLFMWPQGFSSWRGAFEVLPI